MDISTKPKIKMSKTEKEHISNTRKILQDACDNNPEQITLLMEYMGWNCDMLEDVCDILDNLLEMADA